MTNRWHGTFAPPTAAGWFLLLASPAAAQLNGTNIKDDLGLKSGSQASPGA